MQASHVVLCLSLLTSSCTGQAEAGFAINPIINPTGSESGGNAGTGVGGGVAQPGGVVDMGMTSSSGVDMSAGGSGSVDISGTVDSNLVGGRVDMGFPSDTGMMSSDVGMGGATDVGMGMGAGGGFGDVGTGFDSTGGAGMGLDITGNSGTGFDTMVGGTGMGLDSAGDTGFGMVSTGGTGMGLDATGETGMGFGATGITGTGFDTTGGTGTDMSMTDGDLTGGTVTSRGAVAAGVPDRVRVETGPREPDTAVANEAATLLRGLMKETTNFDASSEPTAPGAVEHHSMIAGPPNEEPGFTYNPPSDMSISPGDMPQGAVIRTTKEEKSTFSVSGESSFEHFSSAGSGQRTSGSSAIDLNPVAAGANVLDSGRGMRDFQAEGAAATAIDTSRTDAAVAGVDRSVIGTLEATGTGADGGAVDVTATGGWENVAGGSGTGTGTIGGATSGGLDLVATGRDGTTAEIKVVGGKEGEITGNMGTGTGSAEGTSGRVVDASFTGSDGGKLDVTGGVVRDGVISGGVEGGIDASGTVIRGGKVSVEGPGGAGFDIVGGGKRDTSVSGDLEMGMGGDIGMSGMGTNTAGMSVDMGMTSAGASGSVDISGEQAVPSGIAEIARGVIDSNVVGDTGTGFGLDSGIVTDTGTSADAGFGLDSGMATDTGVGMGGDTGLGFGDTGFGMGGDIGMTGMGTGEASVVRDGTIRDSGVVPVDRSAAGLDGTGAVARSADVSLTGESGASLDASASGVAGTSDSALAADAPGSVNINLQDRQGVIADIKTTGNVDIKLAGPGGTAAEIQTGSAKDRGGAAGETKTVRAGEFDISATGRDGGSVDIAARRDSIITGTDSMAGSTGIDAGFGLDASTRTDAGTGVDTGLGLDSGVVDFDATGGSRADRRVLDALSTVTGQMDGTVGTDTSSTVGGVATGTVDVGANVLDRGLGFGLDSGTVTDTGTVVDAGFGLDSGTGIDTGSTGRDLSLTGRRSGTMTVEGGGVRGGGVDGSLSIDRSGSMSATGTRGDTSFGLEGSRTTSFTAQGSGTVGTGGSIDTGFGLDSGRVTDTGSSADAGFGLDSGIVTDTGTSAGTGFGLDSGVVDLGTSGSSGADRRVLDALSAVTGQMDGTVGTDTSMSGTVDVGANVLDRRMTDFPSSGAASTVVDSRRTDTGPSNGIFGWAGEGERRSAGGDFSMTGGRTGTMTVEGGGVRGGGVDGSLSIDRSGSISATGTRGDTSFGIDGSRTTSLTGQGSSTVSGGIDGSVSFDRSGQISGTGATSDGSVSFEGGRSTSITGGRQDGSLSLSGSRTGSGSVTFDRTGVSSGTGKFDTTRAGSATFEGGSTGTGRFDGRVSGGLTGGAVAGGGRGSEMLSLEDRTVREGEWSATWNYQGPVPEWFRHRVNPAPCRQHGCNLAVCYVPHPRDCKSYIVCQRTALGTYVATRMRCAFGTVWAMSNLWTCARITDQNVGNYDCPNDPCQDPNLSVYPDEDFNHCKIFWTCQNGRSVPECCPPGQRFHRKRLMCVDDPNETCRAQCPLKPERCGVTGPSKQAHYDGNCKTYWDCGRDGAPHPVCCPEGHSFEAATGTCVNTGCTDQCPPEYDLDVCGKIGEGGDIVTAYPMRDNCRTFIKCDPTEGRIASCCRADHYYNDQTMKCERITDILDPCRSAICPDGYQEECRFAPVADPRKMFDIDAGIERDCAPSTVFDKKICTCVFSDEPFKKLCKKEVDAKFDHINEKWHVHNYGDGWISTYAALPKNVTANGNHFATFDGRMGLEVYRYDHNRFHEFTLKLTFQPSSELGANGNRKQVLVSNCQTTEVNGGPSFEVTLDPVTQMITFTGRSATETSVVELQYKPEWNTLTLLYEGENVLAMIEDPNAPGKADSSSARLKGPLLRGMGPLVFGPCKDSNSRPMENGFVGFMSEVIFAKCLDEASKMFMRETLETTLGPAL